MHPIYCFAFAFTAAAGFKGAIAALLALAGAATFGTLITAPHAAPVVPSTSPDNDTILGQGVNIISQYEVLTGTTDVIQGGGGGLSAISALSGATLPVVGTSFIETAGVDATTLATPVAGDPSLGGNDGLTITIIDNGGHAHTVTAAANKIVGNKHLLTFNGTLGSFVQLVARNGIWIPLALSGVTVS
jgi:hypothetical protein